MSLEQSQISIRGARSLATKLYGQCRDNASIYRTLAPCIRRLRNVLEEIEEVPWESQAQWLVSPRFVLQMHSCKALLEELDLTLQSHRCSTHKWQDVLQRTITKLQKSISATTTEFSALYDSMTSPAESSPTSVERHVPSNEQYDETNRVMPEQTMFPALATDGSEEREQKGKTAVGTTSLTESSGCKPQHIEVPIKQSTETITVVLQPTDVNANVAQHGSNRADSLRTMEDAETLGQATHHDMNFRRAGPRHTTAEEKPALPADTIGTEHVDTLTDSPLEGTHDHGALGLPSTRVDIKGSDGPASPSVNACCQQHDTEPSEVRGADITSRSHSPVIGTVHSYTSAQIMVVLDPAIDDSASQTTGITVFEEQSISEPEKPIYHPGNDTTENHDSRQSSSEAKLDVPRSASASDSELEMAVRQEETSAEETKLEVERNVLADKLACPDVNNQQETAASHKPNQQRCSVDEVYHTSTGERSSWQSPFSVFDPLSVDIESASNFLLGPDAKSPSTDGDTSAYTTPVETTPRISLPPTDANEKLTSGLEEDTIIDLACDGPRTQDNSDITAPIDPNPVVDAMLEVMNELQTVPIDSSGSDETVLLGKDLEDAAAPQLDINNNFSECDKASLREIVIVDGNPPVSAEQESMIEGRTAAPCDTHTASLVRADSVHDPDARKSALLGASIVQPADDQVYVYPIARRGSTTVARDVDQLDNTQSTAANEVEEERDTLKTHLKPRWLTIGHASSSGQRSPSLSVPRSRFSLQNQFRRVASKTRFRAAEPPSVDERSRGTIEPPSVATPPTATTQLPSDKNSQQLRISPLTPGILSAPSTTISPVSRLGTPTTTHFVSPCVSPTTKSKDLPPPPTPSRAPPGIPQSQGHSEAYPVHQPPSRMYRIANPSPPSVVSTVSEDLYGSSRPASPMVLRPPGLLPRIDVEIIDSDVFEHTTDSPSEQYEAGKINYESTDIKMGQDKSSAEEQPHEDGDAAQSHSLLPLDEGDTASQQSAETTASSRYFHIELDEPDEAIVHGRSMSNPPPHSDAAVSEAASSRPLVQDNNEALKIEIPSSYHNPVPGRLAAAPSIGLKREQNDSRAGYSLDQQRLIQVCKHWRKHQWESAELYLRQHIETMSGTDGRHTTRRIRHLQGICASMRGQWQRALSYFISVLQTPIRSIRELDEGDFAALYWLGDTYAMLNRRTEALVAYSLAAQLNSNEGERFFGQTILLTQEQGDLMLGTSPQGLMAYWRQILSSSKASADSILARSVIEPSMITRSLELATLYHPSSHGHTNARSRASLLCELDGFSRRMTEYVGFDIALDSFDEQRPWPMKYDPYFTAGNVARGRLCDETTDLLAILANDPTYKVPRNGPVGAGRLECFTCQHLDWLIVAIRRCLTFLEMRWDEVANENGSWFLVRFAVNSKNIIAANYFAISLFKQSMRSGYGVEVCVDNVRSARVLNHSPEYINGVHHSCEKRLKKLIKDYLAHAYKLWLRDGKQSVFPEMPQSLNEQAAGLIRAPTLPRRTKAVYG